MAGCFGIGWAPPSSLRSLPDQAKSGEFFRRSLGYTGSAFVLRPEGKRLSIRKWKFFIIVGVTSSLANGLSLSLLQHGDNQITSALGYLIGDVSGLLACLFLLMYGFRFARLIGSDKLN
jgi:hypothetical protein